MKTILSLCELFYHFVTWLPRAYRQQQDRKDQELQRALIEELELEKHRKEAATAAAEAKRARAAALVAETKRYRARAGG